MVNTRIKFVFWALLLASQWGFAQSVDYGLRLGLLYGGPVPTELDPDSSSGAPKWGPSAAAWGSYRLNDRISLRLEIGYAYRGAEYSQLVREDTMVPIEIIPGVQDTVPSYYIGMIEGNMGLHYLEVPLLFEYRPRKQVAVRLGLNPAFKIGGSDEGTADIQIGDGNAFPDTLIAFENYPDIQRFDLGVTLGAAYLFDFGLELEIRGYRSLSALYREGFLAERGFGGANLYHTHFYIGSGYRF